MYILSPPGGRYSYRKIMEVLEIHAVEVTLRKTTHFCLLT